MSIWPKAKYVISASFLSLVVGVLGFYYEVYGTKTSLVVDVVSESNVMDVRTPLKDLSILFQGQDIQKENSNLKILGVRLVNEGNTNILENYFDSRIPWGLRVDGGRVIEARVTGSNSQYIADNLHVKVVSSNEVYLDKVIFDKGKYVGLELLVLHDRSVEPQIRPLGKIAGMDNIPIRNSFREGDQEGFKSKAFRGPIPVQIARTIGYFLVGLGTVVVVGLAIAGIGSIPSRIKKRSRRKWVRYLPREGSTEKEKKRQALLEIFIEDGLPGLKRVGKTLDNERLMMRAFGARRVSLEEAADFGPHVIAHMHMSPDGRYFYSPSPLESLVDAGIVRRVDKTLEIDPEARELLANLIGQLSEFDEEHDSSPKTKSAQSEPNESKG